MEDSKIEWTDHTFNPWRGCTKISPACQHCYADTQAKRNPAVLGVWGDHGTRVVASEAQWRLPLKWDREAKAAGVRRRVFCASLADVFEDWNGRMVGSDGSTLHNGPAWGVDRPWIHVDDVHIGKSVITMNDVRRRLFALIDATPHLDWLLLTKRPENIKRMWRNIARSVTTPDINYTRTKWVTDDFTFRPNVWLGVTVEDQQRADERIPLLLQVPAAARFLSVEPMLGPVTIDQRLIAPIESGSQAGLRFIDWVICGGESGHGARPIRPDWARSLRDQCQAAGVPFFFKQWGEFKPIEGAHYHSDKTAANLGYGGWQSAMQKVGKHAAGRLLDCREWSEFPRGTGGT